MNPDQQFDRIETTQFSVEVLQYLQRKKQSLGGDYSDESGKFSDSCGLIAVDIAKLLLADGRKPSIIMVSEDISRGGLVFTKDLKPLAFR